jgi:lipoprotein-releasing system permease protein
MNTEQYIARRFMKSQKGSKVYTRPILSLTVFSIAVSLAVMIIAVAVITGFKKEIRNKVIGFGGHIQIINFDSNNSYESSPIDRNQDFIKKIKEYPGIKNVQIFATKPGMIKTKDQIQGVIVKGISSDFDTTFFSTNLVEGRMIRINDSAKSNDILISRKLADLLKLKVKDKVVAFFIDNRSETTPVTRRAFTVCGIYQTSLETFDEQFIFADIRHIQKLSAWNDNQIGGFEILINDYNDLEYLTEVVTGFAGFRFMNDGSQLRIENIKAKYPQIFDWLDLLDMNVIVILVMMLIVSIINMISGIIILILDRTPSIGILKALGSSNASMRKIFLHQAVFIIGKGLIWGNILAFFVLFLQNQFHLVKLNTASYFLEYAPVNFNLLHIVLLNVLTLSIVFIFMFLPIIIVSRIQPAKTIRYS